MLCTAEVLVMNTHTPKMIDARAADELKSLQLLNCNGTISNPLRRRSLQPCIADLDSEIAMLRGPDFVSSPTPRERHERILAWVTNDAAVCTGDGHSTSACGTDTPCTRNASTDEDSVPPLCRTQTFTFQPCSSASDRSCLSGRATLGEVVEGGSESYKLLLALESSIHDLYVDQDISSRPAPCFLSKEDFSYSKKLTVEIQGTTLQCKSYAPQVFRQIRKHLYNIDDACFFASVGRQTGKTTEISTETIGSKSGQKFFISKDGRYFIKTIPAAEAKRLRKMLPEYYEHMKANPNSLLCRFFALLRVKPFKTYLLVMANVLDTTKDIHKRFDLKGSTLGRVATTEQRKSPTVVLKDVDLMMSHTKFAVGSERKEKLLMQLHLDIRFLEQHKLMDYSLFVGVHKRCSSTGLDSFVIRKECSVQRASSGGGDADMELQALQRYQSVESSALSSMGEIFPAANQLVGVPKGCSLTVCTGEESHISEFQVNDGGFSSVAIVDGVATTGEDVYFVGIIDILQEYDWKKRTETAYRRLFYSKVDISCVKPSYYARRMFRFVRNLLE